MSEAISVNGVRFVPRITDAMQEREALAMSQQLGLPEVLTRTLVGRGVGLDDAPDFLAPSLKAAMPDPSHLLDMDKSTARLCQAIESGETIAVFGDYDVDGATSSALLKRYFAALGIDILIYIPDRMKEGYGPNIAAFENLKAQGAKLIITVDCGTVSYDPIAAIAQQGVDVIVIDHHMALPELPKACAVINPNRIDQDSDCGHLAAVGVVFLVLVALNRELRARRHEDSSPNAMRSAKNDEVNLLPFLDMVALGTVCDVVSLTGLNRAFVAQGLKVMAQRQNMGLNALSDIARLDEAPNAYHAGFLLGPRINAGGRVGAAELGSRLLSSHHKDECADIAQRLDGFNNERKAIEASVQEAAETLAESQANQPCIIVAQHGWHEGVIGIVAGRLKEAYSRPAMVIALSEDGTGKGSARSVSGADMGAAITSAKLEGLLIAGGGHAMAAGFSLKADKLDAFIDYMNSKLESAVADYQQGRAYHYDALLSAGGANLSLLNAIDKAGPFGMGNPAPRFVVPSARIYDVARMKDKHLRLALGDADGGKARLKAVCFNCVGTPLGDALEYHHKKQAITLAGQLKRNRWQGYESAQFIIDDAALI
jgi:single-stranded-DNA-specific exonuclease